VEFLCLFLPEDTLAAKPRDIRLLVLDVDGVLTDGSVLLADDGSELKRFNAKDGAAIRWWLRSGRQMAWISGRESPAVLHRAQDLGVKHVHQHVFNKLEIYAELLEQLGLSAEQTACMGDDLMDLPILTRCGFAIAVADAMDEIRDVADLVTQRPGGRGAVAEAVRFLLQAAGDWQALTARYTKED